MTMPASTSRTASDGLPRINSGHAPQINNQMPRGPVFGWASFESSEIAELESVDGLGHKQFTTSGRAAIYHALLQLELPQGSLVLIPTYHCPTMVAPVILAGAQPIYFGISADGLPDLSRIPLQTATVAKAMLVPHYFGLAQSLAGVRRWCDAHQIVLIEDCAHSFFGVAGERSVGSWGDFATASLSKFFPLPEAGLLASASRQLKPIDLQPQGFKAQTKGFFDVLEQAAQFRRLPGLNYAINAMFGLKRALRRKAQPGPVNKQAAQADFMTQSDMSRITKAPLLMSMLVGKSLPRRRIIERRRENYDIYARELAVLPNGRALFPKIAESCAPYVFPIWVDDPDEVYQSMRSRGFPVFRWDQLWPGTPQIDGDVGLRWSHHVLQLLCHQDLSSRDVASTATAVKQLLSKNNILTTE